MEIGKGTKLVSNLAELGRGTPHFSGPSQEQSYSFIENNKTKARSDGVLIQLGVDQ